MQCYILETNNYPQFVYAFYGSTEYDKRLCSILRCYIGKNIKNKITNNVTDLLFHLDPITIVYTGPQGI